MGNSVMIDYKDQLMQDSRLKIENATDYDQLFELVKRVVEKQIGRHRAGLALVLADMPNTIGAFHPVGSNSIVLNKALVRAMRSVVGGSHVNSFIFMVLMHEYLHSLGFLEERDVRKLCRDICKGALGPEHETVSMSTGNWLQDHPELFAMARSNVPSNFERIDRFDSSSMRYIG
jgi:hypothetical protein